MRRIGELPGVQRVAVGNFVPWRDAGMLGPGSSLPSRVTRPQTAKRTRTARLRIVAPGFFAVLGVPLVAGRDFNDDDRSGSELVVIVSQSVAQRLFPNGDAREPALLVDRSVLRQARAAPHRRRRRRRGRRERRARRRR